MREYFQSKTFRAGMWLLLLVAIGGCGRRFVPVEGAVTLDGEPLTGAAIVFCLQGKPKFESGPREAVSFTDEHGRFQLRTSNAEGAVPGAYKVRVSKLARSKRGDLTETLPRAYADEKQTPFEVDVPKSGVRDLVLSVKSRFSTNSKEARR